MPGKALANYTINFALRESLVVTKDPTDDWILPSFSVSVPAEPYTEEQVHGRKGSAVVKGTSSNLTSKLKVA